MAHLRPKILGGTLEGVLVQQALVGLGNPASGKYQHVGRFSEAKEGWKAKLSLFVGRDAETRQKCLIYLHVPLTRKNSRNVKDLYLVIPVEKLQLKLAVICAGDIPDFTADHLKKDGLTTTDNILRVSMMLGCPAYAVMPLLPRTMDTLESFPSQLLSHWRTLSSSKNIDVYLSDPSIIEDVHAINVRIQTGQLATPELDLSHMYRGHRGAVNNWEQYPHVEGTRHHATWNPFLDNDPPPYDAVCNRPPSIPERKPPLDRSDSDDETCSKRAELFWRTTSQPPNEAQLFKDADYLCRPQKRKAIEALTDHPGPPVNDFPRDAFQPIVPGTPTEQDPTQGSAAASHSSHLESNAAAEPRRWLLRARDAEEAMRLSLLRRGNIDSVSTRLDCSPLKEPRPFLEMQEWISKMWDFEPLAHDVYRNELLQLGCLARCRRVDGFDAAKAELQRDFFKRSSSRLTTQYRPSNLQRDAEQLQDWLESRVCRGAVTLLADALMDLHDAAAKVELADAVEESDVQAFYEQKAECCAICFFTFGGRV